MPTNGVRKDGSREQWSYRTLDFIDEAVWWLSDGHAIAVNRYALIQYETVTSVADTR